ncbi:O-antigen ligase family protein [Geobacillus thermodenitrificans]|uniref:O-antigen ligase family protein n=1 Tax=Geobacillus TaxID=129337 RepID=UPI0009C0DD2E|nr:MULTISPECIES: O-antigen ligase family protein [Geobacillus]ATO37812.1 polymerase [Geobacillus thermodenitrificans]OQP08467.1 polymerase [Geobacillus sp. 47C-IIb]QNU32621.1 O-antigen ligase family protein [Geobacillus sp. 47C-IIb]
MRVRQPFTYYAVLLALFLIPLVSYKMYIGPLPLSAEVVMIPLITLAALVDYRQRRIKLNDFPVRPILLAFIAFLLIAIVSLVKAASLAPAIMELARYLSYVVLFFIVVKVQFTREQYVRFAQSFGLSALLVGVYGIIQYIFDISLNTAGLYALKEAKGRVDSTLVNPNYYASFLNLVIPALLLFAVVYWRDKKVQLLTFAVYAIYVINLVLTYTRAAWVSMLGGLVLVILLMPKTFFKNVIRPHILISFAVLLTIVYFMPDVQSRTYSAVYAMEKIISRHLHSDSTNHVDGNSSDEDGGFLDEEPDDEEATQDEETTNRAVVSRVTLWKTGWVMMKENPVIGVGIGNYLVRYKEYVTKYPELYIGHDQYSVHNSYLKVGAETGFLGLIAFVAIYVVYYGYLLRLYFASSDRLGKLITVALIAGSATFIVQNLSNNLIFIPQLNTIFWLISGLAMAFVHQASARSSRTQA